MSKIATTILTLFALNLTSVSLVAADDGDRPRFLERDGVLGSGDDITWGVMTVDEAKWQCIALSDCVGFTHQGGPTQEAVPCYLKNRWNFHQSDWNSYKKQYPSIKSYKEYNGALGGGNDIQYETMTFRQAEQKCSADRKCVGFTYQGPPRTNRPVTVYFKNAWNLNGNGWTSYKNEGPRSTTEWAWERLWVNRYYILLAILIACALKYKNQQSGVALFKDLSYVTLPFKDLSYVTLPGFGDVKLGKVFDNIKAKLGAKRKYPGYSDEMMDLLEDSPGSYGH